MDEILKIKVSIGDRVYPMNIEPHQEEGYRKAAKEINELIQKFESTYELKDKQDALALCAIVLATNIEQKKLDESQIDSTVKDKLTSINELMDAML
ncbi:MULTISPECIES: cell division protein ZapA [Capnocytophaga]|uniref:Cell division protein ZapA n=1 Tax=Capnocytophaga canis TaxID=1848903 RepID=A0A0B7ILD9_9FLAO|nr:MULTISPECIES: cell division protein ZapA [Capnocytophaga]ATA73173.1 cell division protein ZapA [Capnocytophaga sp. H4358]ATA75310.1 cell division protein ZapA [Capnocytophaga sp. H2931]RIY38293.1 cell division protein ZapA [Capnocytophaga canis]CEN45765.1 conserved hypothetical protein [Capnocytophaga canis]CEN46054.1 conserved hypothetical protein [Capnocytophaga canis]